jgi:hypothetical protein
MSLLESIEEEIKQREKTKKEILLEHKKEIELMIKNNISIKKQIELILKNSIVEKLDYSEYRKILVKNFDYTVNPKTTKSKKTKQKNEVAKKVLQPHQTKKTNLNSAKQILSQSISL